MRRRTGAAGIAVAIAAIVPLADPAPAQTLDSNLESDCLSSTYQEAVPIGLEADPGVPDPLCPDALFDAPPDDAPLDEGGLGDDRLDGSGLGDGRPDEGLPDGGGLDPGRPGDGRPDQNRPGTSHSTGQGPFDQGPFDQGGIREIREGDGGVGGGVAHPRGDQLPTISATTRPAPVTTPAPATTAPAPVTSPSVAPTLGTRGGLGGASGTGPSDWDIGIGLSFVTGAALTAGWVIRRRRRA
ncbi:hypothetical protein EV562_104480 [Streptomyces sp. BK208]|uniref:hypothetical protein n=1 Tax=Streptomyces sp. BK208 TaxID=2512150 RepID=UPI0010615B37|nr:hypothetical protein [Streptomyces sp. BK208]TDT39236.1 hypothetical protein EV562_104480 [Streptomyces sp. BK208]